MVGGDRGRGAATSPSWARVGGPLAQYAEGFRGELERLGYTPLSSAVHVRLMAHLSRWLGRQCLEAPALTPATADAYFAERRAAGYYNSLTSKSLKPLVDYLQRSGVLADAPAVPAVAATPAEALLERYRRYLLLERGLATSTADVSVRMARRRRPPPGSASSRPARRGRADELGSLTYIRLACGRQVPGIACTCSPGQGRGGASWLAPVLTAGWAIYRSLPGAVLWTCCSGPWQLHREIRRLYGRPRSFFLLRPC